MRKFEVDYPSLSSSLSRISAELKPLLLTKCSSRGSTTEVGATAAAAAEHFGRQQNSSPNGQFRYNHLPQGPTVNHHFLENLPSQLAVMPKQAIRITRPEPAADTRVFGLESCRSC